MRGKDARGHCAALAGSQTGRDGGSEILGVVQHAGQGHERALARQRVVRAELAVLRKNGSHDLPPSAARTSFGRACTPNAVRALVGSTLYGSASGARGSAMVTAEF